MANTMTGAIVARYGADCLSHPIHKVHEAGTKPELWGNALGALLEILERSDSGIVLMNAALQAHYLNKAARSVVERGDGLVLNERNQLEFLAPKGRKGFGTWLAVETGALAERPRNCVESVVIPRSNGAGYYVAQVSRLASSPALRANPEPGYLVRISDPEQPSLPSTEQLMGLYELTRAQARVALEFARGSSYAQVAEELGVSAETVRSHVKEIYPKTRVNKQADLVRLVSALGRSSI
jgi:DNA-binding CsgD family transcriptional regulator